MEVRLEDVRLGGTIFFWTACAAGLLMLSVSSFSLAAAWELAQAERALPVLLPPADAPETRGRTFDIVVHITASGELKLGRTPVELEALDDVFGEASSRLEECSVLVRADARSPAGLLVQVISAARASGIEKLHVATRARER